MLTTPPCPQNELLAEIAQAGTPQGRNYAGHVGRIRRGCLQIAFWTTANDHGIHHPPTGRIL